MNTASSIRVFGVCIQKLIFKWIAILLMLVVSYMLGRNTVRDSESKRYCEKIQILEDIRENNRKIMEEFVTDSTLDLKRLPSDFEHPQSAALTEGKTGLRFRALSEMEKYLAEQVEVLKREKGSRGAK